MLHHLEEDLDLILIKTKDCWLKLRNQTIFITGGTGFFGIWLQMSFIHINRKLDLNAKIILLTRNKSKFLSDYSWLKGYEEVSFLEGDICDFEFIDDKIDYIIHAATEASVKLNLEQPLTMFETVVNGTKRILEFAKQKEVKSFLLTSSGAVYGKQPHDIVNVDENYVGAPLTFDAGAVYGEGKRMSEVLCAVYYKHYNLPVKIARCYAFVGPFLPLNSHFAIGNFINNALKNEPIIIQGDGTPYRSYMYAADLMIWLWTILFKGADNYPYNVGSDKSISIEELAYEVATATASDSNISILEKRKNEPPLRYVPSVERAKINLGLDLNFDLHQAIKRTVKYHQEAV